MPLANLALQRADNSELPKLVITYMIPTFLNIAGVIPLNRTMSLERAVEAFAGFMVLLSVVLTVFVHPGFVWFTVFIGANLFQQAFTGFCPAAIVFRKVLGFRPAAELAVSRG